MSKAEDVAKTLRTAKKPLSSKEIAERTEVNWNTVRGILVKMRKDGSVVKEDRRHYRLGNTRK